jgi:hypothetical protein
MHTLLFKQHRAWATLCVLTVHYNLFVVIMTLHLYTNFPSVNVFVVLGVLLLLSVTQLLNRAGRRKAQALVLQDCNSRQAQWNALLAGNLGFKEQIARLQLAVSCGSLAAVCEPLDSQNKLVPITVLQAHADIDRLYRDCAVLNFFFQDWVRTWFQSGSSSNDFEFCNPNAYYKDAFKLRVSDCFPDVVRGPIKAPNRVISKAICLFFSDFLCVNPWKVTSHMCCLCCDVINQVYRSYRGQVDRVTDVIRCSIVFTTVHQLVRFIEVPVLAACIIQCQTCSSRR